MMSFDEQRYKQLKRFMTGTGHQETEWRRNLSLAEYGAFSKEWFSLSAEKKRLDNEAKTAAWREKRDAEKAERDAALQAERDRVQASLDAAAAERRAEKEALVKSSARTQWVTAGGDPDDFEQQWPSQYQELLRSGRADELLRRRAQVSQRFW